MDQVFILRVYAGSCFIKDDDRSVLQNGPGDGDALLLSSREGGAALSNHGVIAVRQGRDEVMAARSFGGSHHLLMGGIRATEFDIVLHTVLEEIHILKDHGDISQQAFTGEFFHIVAAHRHGAAVRVIEAGHQIAYRALAGAGRPHNGGSGPLGRGKSHIVEHLAAPIPEGYMGEGHIELLWGYLPAVLVDEVGALQFLQPVQHRICHRQDVGRVIDGLHTAENGEGKQGNHQEIRER